MSTSTLDRHKLPRPSIQTEASLSGAEGLLRLLVASMSARISVFIKRFYNASRLYLCTCTPSAQRHLAPSGLRSILAPTFPHLCRGLAAGLQQPLPAAPSLCVS